MPRKAPKLSIKMALVGSGADNFIAIKFSSGGSSAIFCLRVIEGPGGRFAGIAGLREAEWPTYLGELEELCEPHSTFLSVRPEFLESIREEGEEPLDTLKRLSKRFFVWRNESR